MLTYHLFFSLTIRPPSISTLFPYTTLFRSATEKAVAMLQGACPDVVPQTPVGRLEAMEKRVRSEEHTSELQSLRHLVCRLLLEKKKQKQIKPKDTQSKHTTVHNKEITYTRA